MHRKPQIINPTGKGDIRRIAFVGIDRAGKTTTARLLSQGTLVTTRPTQGFNLETFTFLGVRFNVFDLGGQESFRIFWRQFIPQQEAIVFFVDAADTKRIAQVRIAFNETLSLVNPDTTIMVLANKQDLPNALSVPDLKKSLEVGRSSKLGKIKFFAVSAKTRMGIYKAFQWLASALKVNIGDQMCDLYAFYVYEKGVGIPLIATEHQSKKIMNIENSLLGQDPELVVALHSAIETFILEMTKSRLKAISFKERKSNRVFRLTSIQDEHLVCVLVTPEEDSDIVVSALGEAILKMVHDIFGPVNEVTEAQRNQLVKMVEIITPFIRNPGELKQSALQQEFKPTTYPVSSKTRISPSTRDVKPTEPRESKKEMFEYTPPDSKDSKSRTPTPYKIRSMPPTELASERREQQTTTYTPPTPASEPKTVSSAKKGLAKEKDKKPEDDMLFFRMGVAERIKFLQQERKREREFAKRS
ncbi:MAG: ADP-ribosylation factor-like protein [Candidatus Hodarchaeota archaeon]